MIETLKEYNRRWLSRRMFRQFEEFVDRYNWNLDEIRNDY